MGEPTRSAPPTPPPPGRAARLWRGLKRTAVFLLVAWHLGFFAVRNALDLGGEPLTDWMKERGWWGPYGETVRRADRLTARFGNAVGCEQEWVMFRPPMARGGSFLAVRFEFTDGSKELLPSDNEPDPKAYFRLGGWQTRKLEDQLLFAPDDLADSPVRYFWEGYARHALRRWKQLHPDDPREVRRVVFVRRRFAFPGPDEPPGSYLPPAETEVAAFDPGGRLCP